MVDEPVVPERGLLSVPDEVWDLAVRRAQVIGPLAAADVVGGAAVGPALWSRDANPRNLWT